jgi:hypothetical protein
VINSRLTEQQVTHLITTAEQVASKSAKVVKAQEQGVHLVSEEWLSESIKSGKKADEKSFAVGAEVMLLISRSSEVLPECLPC